MAAVPKVTVEMTVAEHQAVMNLLHVANAFKNIDSAARGMGGGAAAAGDKLDKGFGAVTGTINRAVKAFLSLNMGLHAFHTLVNQVRIEVEAWQNRGREARPFVLQRSTGIQRAQVQLGTGRVDAEGKPFGTEQMIATIDKAVKEKRGLNELGLWAAVSKAYSTGTELPADVLTNIPIRVMELMPEYAGQEAQQEFAQVAGGVANVMKGYWGGGKKIGIDEAIAAYQQFQKISASESPEQFAGAPASMIAAMVKMTSGRELPENAAALVATYQQVGMDPQGRRSATNPMENYMELREKVATDFPELYGMTMDEMTDRLANVDKEKEPRLYRKKMRFLGGLAEGVSLRDLRTMQAGQTEITGNARMKGISAALFDKDSVVHSLYQQFKREVKGAAEPVAVEREFKFLSDRRSEQWMSPLIQENARIAAEQAASRGTSQEAEAAFVQDIYKKAVMSASSAAGQYQWEASLTAWLKSAGKAETNAEYVQDLIGSLEKYTQDVETMRRIDAASVLGNTPYNMRKYEEATVALTGAIKELNYVYKQMMGDREGVGVRPRITTQPAPPVEPGS